MGSVLTQVHAQPIQGQTQSQYKTCVDYFALGGSRCQGRGTATVVTPTLPPVIAADPQQDPVQEFLDNHGKPPREFAEFYVNPTPQNALRWVSAFQAQKARADALAVAWREAEQAMAPAATAPTGRPSQSKVVQEPQMKMPPAATPTSSLRFGAYAPATTRKPELLYYFSASCPFCARLKPDLQALTQTLSDKLVFTCVDVTPLSQRQSPVPANRDGLPCDWRTPNPGELERLEIRQTPTLLVSRGAVPPERLSGPLLGPQVKAWLAGMGL